MVKPLTRFTLARYPDDAMTSTAIILAAGLGSRMKSAQPKALHRIAGQPMLRHLITSCEAVFDRIVVVVGPEMEAVAQLAAPHPVVVQHDRLGTAHAALQAAHLFGEGDVAVLYADNPLIRVETLRRLLARRAPGDVGLALLAMRPDDPAEYGRVIEQDGYVRHIAELADATEAERAVMLCNAGVLCGEAAAVETWLRAVDNDNARGEYYLTDIVELAVAQGVRVAAVEAPFTELRGINSRAELAEAEAEMQRRLREAALDAGVTMTAPETVFLCADTRLAPDVTIGPHVVFGPGVVVESGAEILSFCHLTGCHIGPDAIIGPFARMRPGTVIGARAHVGNFVELKASTLGEGSKANHLTYLGDSTVGARTNVGAGTITCNYDGFAKHRTTIGSGAFIGTNAVLVAPVAVGDGAFIAAGSVITRDIEADAMAFGRATQTVKPGRAAEFRAARQKKE
jgi:bifunctional UDP-N-acetylglucosamine pyrophosphorylase/glucosamine-1-phosphate N-acetyltransferase